MEDENDKRFHQDIKEMEKRYQGEPTTHMLVGQLYATMKIALIKEKSRNSRQIQNLSYSIFHFN